MSDAQFQELLEATSRSFTLGIRALEPRTQAWVRQAYLLCRVFDTYEDSTTFPLVDRRAGLEASLELLEALASEGAGRQIPEMLAAQRHNSLIGTTHEQALLRLAPALWISIAGFPLSIRHAFSKRLRPMVQGMLAELSPLAQSSSSPRSVADTDRYCYSVAGTVGELLTEIFAAGEAFSSLVDPELFSDAVDFGKALQLVNIAKDYHVDRASGRCYWPGLSAHPESSPTPTLAQLSEAFQALGELFEAYRSRAWAYVGRIDKVRRPDVHRFCVFPLRMAEETMDEGRRDLKWLAEGGTFKVSRVKTLALLAETGLGLAIGS